jgi:drug/metabolite transporter (DMT)-like permease
LTPEKIRPKGISMDYTNIPAAQLRRGSLIRIVSGLALGSAIIFIRYAYAAGVTPGTAIFLRFFVAGLALSTFLTITHRWAPLPRRRIVIILGLGFVAYTTLGVTWFVALKLSPAWLVSLIAALHPLAINLGSWLLLREKIPARQVAALAAVLTGSALLFWQPFVGVDTWTGIILMLFNVLTMGAYIVVGQRWMVGVPPMTSVTYTVWGAAVGTFLYALIAGQFSFNFAPMGWFWVFCFAVVSTSLGIIALWRSIELIGASRSSILGSFEVLYSVMLAVLVLGEQMSPMQIVGGGFILLGIFLVQWQPGKTMTNNQ